MSVGRFSTCNQSLSGSYVVVMACGRLRGRRFDPPIGTFFLHSFSFFFFYLIFFPLCSLRHFNAQSFFFMGVSIKKLWPVLKKMPERCEMTEVSLKLFVLLYSAGVQLQKPHQDISPAPDRGGLAVHLWQSGSS